MASDVDSSESIHPGDPSALPFDPPGNVRMTAELRFKHTDDRRPIVNQYLRGHRVGKGQHGEVWVCWDLSDERRELAIKAVKRNNPRAEKMNLLRRRNLPTSPHTPLTEKLGSAEHKIRKEIAIMKKCRHGHIVRLLEVIDDKLNDRIYMVMEYLAGGEIKWRNEQGEPVLTVDQCRRICRDVILGLEYLHYQGIIHRDIKPANLLWTADRQMVKISDFGVSHFSYAQRLAAANGQVAPDNRNDPILLDDSDLSKRAGTPPFLAPEVIAEYNSTDPSPSISTLATNSTILSSKSAAQIHSSSTIHVSASRRPPITKAIDIWALGVTLYCLLFGRIPFKAADSSEYVLYNIICNQDWEPDATMGYDRIPTGGRHPKSKNTEGAIVMNFLDKLLQKDVTKRMALDEAKRYPWILRDIAQPQEWLRETSPSRHDMVMVSESETRTAMTSVRFSWGWHKRLTNRISSLFRNVRPLRPTAPGYDDDDNFGVRSTPTAIAIERHKSASARMAIGPDVRNKGKRRAAARPAILRDESTSTNVGRRRSKSIERWARSAAKNTPHDPNVARPMTGRRGSETLLLPESQAGSSQPQSRPSSRGRETPTLAGSQHHNRFSLSSMKYWRPHSHKPASQASSPLDTSSATSYSHGVEKKAGPSSPDILVRRSDEVLRHHGREPLPNSHDDEGLLTAARRASSWGEPINYIEDVTSLNSGDHDGLDDDAMFLGAGGVCNDPSTLVSNLPLGLANHAPEVISNLPLALRHPQPERLLIGSAIPSVPDPASGDPGHRPPQMRSATTSPSPLAQVAYESDLGHSDDGGGEEEPEEYDDDLDDDFSFFRNTHAERQAESEAFRANLSQMYDNEDEDSDEESIPIEVKRRRPSVSVTAASPPPPSDFSDDGPLR